MFCRVAYVVGRGVTYVLVIDVVEVNGSILFGSCHPPPATTMGCSVREGKESFVLEREREESGLQQFVQRLDLEGNG